MAKEIAGHRFYVWELPPGRANESFDARVYGYGALCPLLPFGLRLNAFTQRATALYGDANASTQPGEARRVSTVFQFAWRAERATAARSRNASPSKS